MSSLLNLLYVFIGEPSVSKAVKNINSAVKKLEKASAHHNGKAASLEDAAIKAAAKASSARDEAIRAERIADKMSYLLS